MKEKQHTKKKISNKSVRNKTVLGKVHSKTTGKLVNISSLNESTFDSEAYLKREIKKKTSKKKAAKKKKKKKLAPVKRKSSLTEGGLTEKQGLFVRYYIGVAEFNATKAAKLAGNSEKTAYSIGHENLSKPKIAAAIFKAIEKRTEQVETSAKWVLERLQDQAIADLADIYEEETGALKPVHQWPKVWRQGLVTGVETKEEFEYVDGDKVPAGFVVKVKLSERIKRDELIGKHHAMFTDNVNLEGGMILKSLTDKELDEKLANMRKQNNAK